MRYRWVRYALLLAATPAWADATASDAAVTLDKLEVRGRRVDLVGEAVSASAGKVGRDELASRPRVRTGDLLEFVPGLVATQHSGSGKANQYFLRGFNLDHGTDFATLVEAMPVNQRTHGHGQGYSDLNFIIPELVEELEYRKGTYYADIGDFSSAGSARFTLSERLPTGIAQFELGEHRFARSVLADSFALGGGDLLYGAEVQAYDGPWEDIDEGVEKKNLMLRYSADLGGGRARATFLGYDNEWNSPDQIPQRAVDQGLTGELGSLDTTLGGASSRYSLSGGWTGSAWGGDLSAQAYVIDHDFVLWSNFTYFLDDADQGDQFQQFDDRRITGFQIAEQWERGRQRWRLGAEGRRDDIAHIGLRRSVARVPVSTVREDAVDERSLGLFAAHEFDVGHGVRTYLGARSDRYDFDVAAGDPRNSGTADDTAASLKASLTYSPLDSLELYASHGDGFHSNDARGTTIVVDPVSGELASRVDPLVASRGSELGLRWFMAERMHLTAALWRLQLDSELLFVGDAGNTEASRPSRREGVELGVYWFGSERFGGELEASYTDARFEDDDPAGARVPGAIPWVVSAGLNARVTENWTAAARLRHFGRYPLIEDGSRDSEGSTLVNLRLGREWNTVDLYFDVLNALDSDDHDIDYFYASRLPGEAADGVDDIHFHGLEPRTVRATLRWRF